MRRIGLREREWKENASGKITASLGKIKPDIIAAGTLHSVPDTAVTPTIICSGRPYVCLRRPSAEMQKMILQALLPP